MSIIVPNQPPQGRFMTPEEMASALGEYALQLVEATTECYRLATQVEELESHIAAIEDGLDDELTTI